MSIGDKIQVARQETLESVKQDTENIISTLGTTPDLLPGEILVDGTTYSPLLAETIAHGPRSTSVGLAYSIVADDDFIYCVIASTLYKFDSKNMKIVSSVAIQSSASSLAITRDYIYMGNNHGNLYKINKSDLSTAATVANNGNILAITAGVNYIYISVHNVPSLKKVHPGNLTTMGLLTLSSGPNMIGINEPSGFLYYGSSGSIEMGICNIGSMTSYISAVSVGGGFKSFSVKKGLVYIAVQASSRTNFKRLNSSLGESTSVAIKGTTTESNIAVSDNYVYVFSNNGNEHTVTIFHIGDTFNHVTQLQSTYAGKTASSSNSAYIVGNNGSTISSFVEVLNIAGYREK